MLRAWLCTFIVCKIPKWTTLIFLWTTENQSGFQLDSGGPHWRLFCHSFSGFCFPAMEHCHRAPCRRHHWLFLENAWRLPQSFPPQSSAIVILCFVVQGLVLGPHLFIFYMADLADKVQQHQVEMHSFADDTQLYLYCHHDETTAAVTWLKTCLSGVRTWMASSQLKWTWIKRNFCGLGQGSVPNICSVVKVCRFRLAQKTGFPSDMVCVLLCPLWKVSWLLEQTLWRHLSKPLLCCLWTTATACWPGLQTTRSIGYGRSWMQQCNLFRVQYLQVRPGSIISVAQWSALPEHINNKLNITVHHFLQEKAPRYHTWSTVAHQFRKSPAIDNYTQSQSTKPYCSALQPSTFGQGATCFFFRSPVYFVELYWIISMIQHWVLTVLGNSLKRSY